MSADIGLIGIAVMGQNLVLNMNDKGFVVSVFNRTTSKVDAFLANEGKGTRCIGTHSAKEFCNSLKKPRRIMMLVRAGEPVDETIQHVLPYLEKNDIVIDGGNSHFRDTERRWKELGEKGIFYIGCGVSGGEEGARHGPSLMPGGSPEAWTHVKHILQSIAAKTNGEPCCDWVGPGGSGHYVKMVHNGIEYGDMQLISEAYDIMKSLGMNHDEIATTFSEWNKSELDSYLIEITAAVMAFKDTDGKPLLPKIRDSAGQKGTGKWTGIDAMDLGVPLTLIAEAVFSRCLSSLIDERQKAAELLEGPNPNDLAAKPEERKRILENLKSALYASKIISYAQGFMLLREAAKAHNWGSLNYGGIALMWRGGCIIRSKFLGNIKQAFDANPDLPNLLFDKFFRDALAAHQNGWRHVVGTATSMGIPVPALSTALAFYDGIRTKQLPANLIQALRDYFGAHTYELLSKPGEWVHTNWTGTGGRVTSNAYSI